MTDPAAPPLNRSALRPAIGACLRLLAGGGAVAAACGLFLLWDPAEWILRASQHGGVLAAVLPAMPGLLVLLGTAAMGYALIRRQES